MCFRLGLRTNISQLPCGIVSLRNYRRIYIEAKICQDLANGLLLPAAAFDTLSMRNLTLDKKNRIYNYDITVKESA